MELAGAVPELFAGVSQGSLLHASLLSREQLSNTFQRLKRTALTIFTAAG